MKRTAWLRSIYNGLGKKRLRVPHPVAVGSVLRLAPRCHCQVRVGRGLRGAYVGFGNTAEAAHDTRCGGGGGAA
jgi:hypothetical protein